MGISKMTGWKVVLILVLSLTSTLSKPNPDFTVQEGDDGTYGGHGHDHGDHGHDHGDHGHHDNHEEELVPPPPPSPPAPGNNDDEKPGKQCTLVKETENVNPPMCLKEPECEEKCRQVPKETCKTEQRKQCQTRYEDKCETSNQKKCQLFFTTKPEVQCKE